VRRENARRRGQSAPEGTLPRGALRLGDLIPVRELVELRLHALAVRGKAAAESVAREELVNGAGTQFDPRVVGALLEVLDEREADQAALSEAR
jgi:hypothetical protein